MMVATASRHRKDAFEAAEFLQIESVEKREVPKVSFD